MTSEIVPPSATAIGLFTGLVLYFIGGALYRLYFSPLARFPGPKIAAITFWYGFYYDAICKGQYIWKIEQMHAKYGPVVRINPDEIHVNDPNFYSVLYAGARENREKVFKNTRQFGMPDSILFSVPQKLHRMRRAILNPFFSKASVYKLEPVIQDKVDQMLERMQQFRVSRQPIPLFEMFAAYSNDVVMEYAFARSDRRLAQPDFDPVLLNALVSASEMAHWMLHFNWVFRILQSLPLWLAKKLNPGLHRGWTTVSPVFLLTLTQRIKDHIRAIQNGTNKSNEKTDGSHRTIFHDVLEADIPASEKRLERMWQEGMIVVGAGTDTTAWTLVVAMVYIILNPPIRQRLEAELKAATTEKGGLQLSDLEQLPYLSACIKESLRLGYGLAARLPRVAPDQVLEVPGTSGLAIQPGTKVMMSSVLMHRHPSVFPQPDRFDPNRWLENPRLDNYLVTFSKGARSCLGINLAYAEIYMALAGVFGQFPLGDDEGPRLELLKGADTLKDVTIAGDMFLPAVLSGQKHIEAVFK
ncbi:cytochrome P450 [Ustulina deusta]|nr:cytochrome P450 [Ustulina deusta]